MSDCETELKFANECRIRMKWEIKKDNLKDALEREVSLCSEKFHASTIPGVQYYLGMRLKENNLWIFLHLDRHFVKARNIKAKWAICVESVGYEAMFDTEYGNYAPDSYGKLLCKPDEIFDPEKMFFKDGVMEVELEGTLKVRGIKRKAVEPLSLARVLWNNDDDKDITLVVKDDQIKVHKWVLCCNSPVFKAELESGLMETQENKINITDFDIYTVEVCVRYMYEDEEDFIEWGKVIDCLRFADKYDIKRLHNYIQAYMITYLYEKNVVDYANASVTFNAPELKEFCICFLMTWVENKKIIKNANKLKDEILQEIGRRSVFSSSE